MGFSDASLHRNNGQALGLGAQHEETTDFGACWRMEEITSNGSVEVWNVQQPESQRLVPGIIIVSADGDRDQHLACAACQPKPLPVEVAQQEFADARQESVHKPSDTFEIVLEGVASQALGLRVQHLDIEDLGACCRVVEVSTGGFVEKWNTHQPERRRLFPGSIIVSANGKVGSARAIRSELERQDGRTLVLRVRKGAGTTTSIGTEQALNRRCVPRF